MSIKKRTSKQGQQTRVLRMSLSTHVFCSVTHPFPFLELVLMLDMITAQSKLSNLPINHVNSKTRPKLSLRCRHRHYPHCGSATGLVSVFKIDEPVHIDRVLCLFNSLIFVICERNFSYSSVHMFVSHFCSSSSVWILFAILQRATPEPTNS